MHVLRIAQKLYPDVTGGIPYHAHAMSRDQAAMGHDVTVVTVRHDSSLPAVEEHDGYTVHRFDPTVTLLGNDISLSLARFLHNFDDVDVIHAHSHIYFATNLAVLKRKLADVPLAITNHGLFSQNAPRWLFDLYLRSLGRWTLNRADVVFCYTDVDKKRLREYGVQSEISVVPNGIDVERFTPDGPESDLVQTDGNAVVFVGRLVEGKRPELALEAIERVREARPDTTLYFCGNGSLQPELLKRASSLGNGVRFLGQVPYDEMPKIYRSADALVLPSRAEGVPRTVLEAQAASVPVVASDLEQIRSVATTRDRLVENGDVDAYASALEGVLEDDDDPAVSGTPTAWTQPWEETVTRTTRQLAELTGEEPTLVHQ